MIHLRNVRASHDEHPTRYGGVTWCGKKLVGMPATADGIETYSSYGTDVAVSDDPAAADCPHCRERFDAAYNAAFPEGLKPIATIRFDDPQAESKLAALMERLSSRSIFTPSDIDFLEELAKMKYDR